MKKIFRITIVIIFALSIMVIPAYSESVGQIINEEFPEDNPYLVKDIKTANQGSDPYGFMRHGNQAYFSAQMDDDTVGLWKTDGTSQGTELIKEGLAIDSNYVEYQGNVFFGGIDASHYSQIWKSDGTFEGTIKITDDLDTDPSDFGMPGENFYLRTGFYGYITHSDGTLEGTVQHDGVSPRSDYVQIGDAYYYICYFWHSSEYGICHSGGTLDLNISNANPIAYSIFGYDNNLYFASDDGIHGEELWRTNGLDGPALFMDINPDGDSKPQGYFSGNNMLFFLADDGEHGMELWRTDGSLEGTILLTNRSSDLFNLDYVYYLGSLDHRPNGLPGGAIFSIKMPDDPGRSIWFSDGTPGEMIKLADLWGNSVYNSLVFNGFLYFTNSDSEHGNELWRTDGTVTGTQLWLDIAQGSMGSEPKNFALCGNLLCFSADDSVHGQELWSSDGTIENTFMVMDINTAAAGSMPWAYQEYAGELYFRADDDTGRHLWQSNGNMETTQVLFDDIEIGKQDDYRPEYYFFKNKLFFTAAAENSSLPVLWVMDLTTGLKMQLPDNGLSPDNLHPLSYNQLATQNYFYYLTTNSEYDKYLWITDGTEAGTKLIVGTDETNRDQWANIQFGALGDKLIVVRTNKSYDYSDISIIDQEFSEANIFAGTNFTVSLIGSDENRFYYTYAYKVFYVDDAGVSGELINLPETFYPFNGFLVGEKIFLIGNHSGIKIYVTDIAGSFLNLVYSGSDTYSIIDESFEYNGGLGIVASFYDQTEQRGYSALIISDGTAENSYQISNEQYNVSGVHPFGKQLYFIALNYNTRAISLMKTAGFPISTVELFDFGDSLCFRNFNHLGQEVALYNGVYYFPLNDNAPDGSGHGCEVWAYDLLTHDLFMPLIER